MEYQRWDVQTRCAFPSGWRPHVGSPVAPARTPAPRPRRHGKRRRDRRRQPRRELRRPRGCAERQRGVRHRRRAGGGGRRDRGRRSVWLRRDRHRELRAQRLQPVHRRLQGSNGRLRHRRRLGRDRCLDLVRGPLDHALLAADRSGQPGRSLLHGPHDGDPDRGAPDRGRRRRVRRHLHLLGDPGTGARRLRDHRDRLRRQARHHRARGDRRGRAPRLHRRHLHRGHRLVQERGAPFRRG